MNDFFPSLSLPDVWHTLFDSMVLTGERGDILALNRSAARLFAASPSRLIGTSVFELIPSKELNKSFQAKTNRTGMSISLGTQQLMANLSVIQSSQGAFYFLLALKNVTQIHQLQHQLHQMNEIRQLYDAILDELEEGICVVDVQGKILFFNRKMGEFHTLEPESVREKRVTEIWPVDEASSTLMTALKTEKTLTHRETHFATNGKAITTLSRTIPLFVNSKKKGAMEIANDITERKHMTETILRLQKTGKEIASAQRHTPDNNTRFRFEHIVHASPVMSRTIEQARRAARSTSNILIVGETGTGKELFAQSIHNESPRKNKPFIAQNCAALPESLLEGLLFGTTVGSFTGAVDRPGLFEQAHGGTLLLDEINSMGTNLQAKLLRVLQEKKVQRLGSSKLINVDVRIIATINEDPLAAIASGKLREDLYYRLAVVNIVIPPLRNRKEDISVLVNHFVEKHAEALGVKVKGIDDDVWRFFMEYDWPGNVRQLEHTLEGALNLMEDDSFIDFDHLPPALKSKWAHKTHGHQPPVPDLFPSTGESLPEQVERLERTLIERALKEAKGNLTKASERLGISRQNLNYKLKKYNISPVLKVMR